MIEPIHPHVKEHRPYRVMTKVVLLLGATALSTYTLSGHLSKLTNVTQGPTGSSAFSLLAGHVPEVKGGVGTDPTAQAMEIAKGLVGGGTGGGEKKPKEAKLVMFPSDPSMTPEQRAKLMADAERMRPTVPETPKRR